MALDDLYDYLIAQAVVTFRKNCVLPSLFDQDVGSELMMKGDVVNVPIVRPRTTSPVVPGPVRPGGPTPAPDNVPMTLDFWEDSAFTLTDREYTNIGTRDDYVPKELVASSIAIANRVDQTCFDLYKDVYGIAGTPGTTPFATSTLEAQEAVRVLSSQDSPKTLDRHIVLDEFGYANALGVPTLQRVDASGASITLREAIIGRALGFWWHEDNQAPTHTKGTGAGYLVDQADVAVGDTSINIDTGTGTFLEGDIFTVQGDDQTYVVTVSDLTGGNDRELNFSPAAKVAWAQNAPITFAPSHVVGLAFERGAFAFVSRPASQMAGEQVETARVRTWVDMDEMGNGSGIVMSLEVSREHYQTSYYLSAMWGCQTIAPNMAVRIAG